MSAQREETRRPVRPRWNLRTKHKQHGEGRCSGGKRTASLNECLHDRLNAGPNARHVAVHGGWTCSCAASRDWLRYHPNSCSTRRADTNDLVGDMTGKWTQCEGAHSRTQCTVFCYYRSIFFVVSGMLRDRCCRAISRLTSGSFVACWQGSCDDSPILPRWSRQSCWQPVERSIVRFLASVFTLYIVPNATGGKCVDTEQGRIGTRVSPAAEPNVFYFLYITNKQ